jgi:hypothetical protein|tara:strand:- start:1353 stop:1532 length:180 start_codon:yes stop_codon:yes gene_type:complete
MDKAKIEAIRKRIDKVKEPQEVYNDKGQLKKIIMPHSAYGHLEVEIIYSREELHKNKTI